MTKALSIRQPWVWSIFNLGKGVENRDWRPGGTHVSQAMRLVRSGERFLIHASSVMTRADYYLCLATLHDISRTHPFPPGMSLPAQADLPRGGFVGSAILRALIHRDDYGMVNDARVSPWFFGPYGLVLSDVQAGRFIAFRGALGFFNVPTIVARQALAA